MTLIKLAFKLSFKTLNVKKKKRNKKVIHLPTQREEKDLLGVTQLLSVAV